jgi:hypothetical protein
MDFRYDADLALIALCNLSSMIGSNITYPIINSVWSFYKELTRDMQGVSVYKALYNWGL